MQQEASTKPGLAEATKSRGIIAEIGRVAGPEINSVDTPWWTQIRNAVGRALADKNPQSQTANLQTLALNLLVIDSNCRDDRLAIVQDLLAPNAHLMVSLRSVFRQLDRLALDLSELRTPTSDGLMRWDNWEGTESVQRLLAYEAREIGETRKDIEQVELAWTGHQLTRLPYMVVAPTALALRAATSYIGTLEARMSSLTGKPFTDLAPNSTPSEGTVLEL